MYIRYDIMMYHADTDDEMQERNSRTENYIVRVGGRRILLLRELSPLREWE